jgi:hypothetical protein
VPKGEYEYDVRATEQDGSERSFTHLHKGNRVLEVGDILHDEPTNTRYRVVRVLPGDRALEVTWAIGPRQF